MADNEQEKNPKEGKSPRGGKDPKEGKRISERDRFHYIGFEVFPGKPKDLFKSDAEKQKLVDDVQSKRAKEDILREGCTLMEERVSGVERIVLTVASLVVLAAFLLPWYSAYTEVAIEAEPEPQAAVAPDSLTMASVEGDSLAGVAVDSGVALAAQDATEDSPRDASHGREVVTHEGSSSQEEIITGHIARVRTTKNYSQMSGFGSLAGIGSAGSYLFSSGFILMITALLLILFTLACILVPIYNLYGIYGKKGNPDEAALTLKKNLRLNWLPLVLFTVIVCLSFLGSEYGFDASSTFTSIGESYGPGALLSTLSYGMFVAIAASVLAAVKGIEI